MALLISFPLTSTGELSPIALFAGESSAVAALLVHDAPLLTVMVNCRETVDGQSPKRASTSQEMVPCGTGAVSCVAPMVVVPMKKLSPADAVPAVAPQTR